MSLPPPPMRANVERYIDAATSPAPLNDEQLAWGQIESQFAQVLGGLPKPRNPGDTP